MDSGDDGRSRWKQLQAHLADARAQLNAGELGRATEAVDLALAIDPDFLAARALRHRIDSVGRNPLETERPPEVASTPARAHAFGLAGLEERARQRRIEHRMGTARRALAGGQFGEARAALAEVQELAPDRPELTALGAELASVERSSRAIPSRAPWFVAVCLLCCSFAGAAWLAGTRHSSARPAQLLRSSPTSGLASAGPTLPSDPPPLTPNNISATGIEAGASGASPAASADIAIVPLAAPVGFIEPAFSVPSAPPSIPPAEELAPRSLPPAPMPVVEPAVAATLPLRLPNDDRLVRDVLQRYRVAYDGLNAKSAQEVWPDVDAPALERAFDGLASQRLTFDECAVNLNGAIATATCRGTLGYTPKTGSRELRVEARVWTFTMRKIDGAWQIDGARVTR